MNEKRLCRRYVKNVWSCDAFTALNKLANWEHAKGLTKIHRKAIENGLVLVAVDDSYGKHKFDFNNNAVAIYNDYAFDDVCYSLISYWSIINANFESLTSGARLSYEARSKEWGILELESIANPDGSEYEGLYYNTFMRVPEANLDSSSPFDLRRDARLKRRLSTEV